MTKKKSKKDLKKRGRKPMMNSIVIDKLELIFSKGGTDKEACLYAGISMDLLYKYQRENPEFIKRKELLKEKTILQARETIVKNLCDVNTAKWYLEKKANKEFNSREIVETKDNKEVEELRELVTELSKPDENTKQLSDRIKNKRGGNKKSEKNS